MQSLAQIRNALTQQYPTCSILNRFDEHRFFDGNIALNLVDGVNGAVVEDLTPTFTSPNLTGFQGYTTDGINHYVFNSDGIRKFNASWVLTASNLAPYAGLTLGQNRMGDGQYRAIGDHLYVAVYGDLVDCGNFSGYSYVKYNASDLSLSSEHSIMGAGQIPLSGIAVDEIGGYVVGSSWCDGASVSIWDLTTNVYAGKINFDAAATDFSKSSSGPSAVFVRGDSFYLAAFGRDAEGNKVYVFNRNGSLQDIFYLDDAAAQENEGIDFSQDTLRVNTYPSATVKYYKPTNTKHIKDGTLDFVNTGFVEYQKTFPDSGTIVMEFSPKNLTNSQALWDTNTAPNDIESWVYSETHGTYPRTITARLLNGSTLLQYQLPADAATKIYRYAFSWKRSGGTAACNLYVDDGAGGAMVLRSSQTNTWIAPKDHFFLNGGHIGNTRSAANYFNFAFFNDALTLQEIDGFDFGESVLNKLRINNVVVNLLENIINSAVSWKIINEITKDMSWSIYNEAVIDFAWDVLKETDGDIGWKVKSQLDLDSAWKIINTQQINTDISWALNGIFIKAQKISKALSRR